MEKKIQEGQVVTLLSALGNIDRVVVRVTDQALLVCRPEEKARADSEDREPALVGFRFEDVVTVRE